MVIHREFFFAACRGISHIFFWGQSHTHCVRLCFSRHFVSFCPAFVVYDAVQQSRLDAIVFYHALVFMIFDALLAGSGHEHRAL